MQKGLFILFVLLVSCSTLKKNEHDADSLDVSELITSQCTVIGYKIGDHIDDDLILFGDIKDNGLKEDSSYRLTLLTRLKKVHSIYLDLYPKDSLTLRRTFNSLQIFLDSAYQKSSPAPGFATWKTGDSLDCLVEVSLVDESEQVGRPSIMVEWRAKDGKLYEE